MTVVSRLQLAEELVSELAVELALTFLKDHPVAYLQEDIESKTLNLLEKECLKPQFVEQQMKSVCFYPPLQQLHFDFWPTITLHLIK